MITIDVSLIGTGLAIIVAAASFFDRGRKASQVEARMDERIKRNEAGIIKVESRAELAHDRVSEVKKDHQTTALNVARLLENSDYTAAGIREIKEAIRDLSKDLTDHVVKTNGGPH